MNKIFCIQISLLLAFYKARIFVFFDFWEKIMFFNIFFIVFIKKSYTFAKKLLSSKTGF
jgi:hypothetical protein